MQLLEHGDMEALTTNAIAAKAGVSIGTLYQYFDSKHALLDALVRRELDTMTTRILASFRDAPTEPGGRIREIVHAVTSSYGGRSRVHRLLMEYSGGRARAGGTLAPFYAELIALCMADEAGIAGTGARAMTPAEAFVLTHAMTGVLRTMAASADAPPPEEIEAALVKLVTAFAAGSAGAT